MASYLVPFGLDSSWRFLLELAEAEGRPIICSRLRGLKSYRGRLSAASFFFLKIFDILERFSLTRQTVGYPCFNKYFC